MFFDILTAVVHPIILYFKLILAKCVRNKILAKHEISLVHSFNKNVKVIKELEEKISRHIRLQQGLETIYQLSITVILLCYAKSKTRTTQSLSALFEVQKITVIGIPMAPEVVITINILVNIASYTLANMNGIRGHCQHFPLMSKLLLCLCILSSTMARIIAFTMFFAPALGLFNLLYHYKGMRLVNP